MVKYTIVALLSVLFFASNLGKNGFGAEGIELDLGGTACAAADAGTANVTMFTITGCQTNMLCNIMNGTMQRVALQFDPAANYSGNRKILWQAILPTDTVTVANQTVTGNYMGGEVVTEMFEFSVAAAGTYPMRLTVVEDATVIACRSIPVIVIDKAPDGNNGTMHGESCTMANFPCAFAYSNCVAPAGSTAPTCNCLTEATEDGGACKVRSDGYCSASDNCVAFSTCTDSMCKCDSEVLDAALGTCSGVGALVSTSALLFIIQLVAYAFK